MDEIIMAYQAAEELADGASFIEIPWEDEGILLHDDGRIDTLLPGSAHPLERTEPHTLLMFRRGAVFAGVAGAAGGWARFSCRLLSPRRFVRFHGEEIREQLSAEAILTRMMRQILAEGLRSADGGPIRTEASLRAAAWRECHERAKEGLLRSGWLLTSFRLEYLKGTGGREICRNVC